MTARLSIRKKLILVLVGTGLSALLLAGAVLLIHSRTTFRKEAGASLAVLGDMLAASVKGAVDLDDRQTATATLAALAGNRDLNSARLYRLDGSLFASYVRPGYSPAAGAPGESNGTVFGDQGVQLTRTLALDGQPFARLSLVSSFATQQQQYRASLLLLLGVGAVAGLCWLLIAMAAQRVFTAPLLQLTTAAESVHTTGDYRVRAPVVSRDEIGRLAEAFNKMLAHIQERDAHLAESLAFQKAILTNAGLAVIICQPDSGIIRFFNPAAEAMLGYSADEVVGKTTPALWHVPAEVTARAHELAQELGEPVGAGFDALIAKTRRGQPDSREWTFIRRDGGRIPVFLVITAMHGRNGELIGYCGIVTDLSERKHAEESLRESGERFRLLVENSNDLVLLTNGDGQIIYASPNHQAITGRAPGDLLGHNMLDLVHPADLLPLAAKLHQHLTTGAFRYRFADNTWHWLEASSRSFHLATGEKRGVIVSRDVTDRVRAEEKRQQLEEQLRQSQKLEAIGTLAGGIAHDFNNILTGIMGNIQLAGMDLGEQHPSHQRLRDATKASHRARELVAQILTFSRRGEQLRIAARIGPVVREALRLLRASLPTTIEIETDIDDQCPAMLCDVSQIHQIIMNLGTNAAHAMRDRGSKLTVALRRVHHDAESLARHPQLRPDLTICLSLQDEGSGMSPTTLERIFEPFYTTKAPGEGTGLGLAVVHGIVQDYGGAIAVESTPDQGTVFRLYFAPAQTDTTHPHAESPAPLGRGNNARILLIDDDAMVCNVASAMLRRLGYRPVPFLRPEDALAAFVQAPDSFDAVLTDLTMPNLSGVELARRLLGHRPDLPVIIATGYLRTEAIELARVAGVQHFARKPYALEELAALLGEALPARQPAPEPEEERACSPSQG